MEYCHTQRGSLIIATIATVIGFALFSFATMGAFQPSLLAALLLLILVLGLFQSLTIEIKNNTLLCRFGVGFIQKRIILSEIEDVRSVRNPWYAGWGIRWLPGQYWLWNVSGFQAIELVYKNGKRFRIGTDEPEALLQAIRMNRTGAL